MKRRLIGQKTALTLTLPAEWVREHNLRAKDEIDVDTQEDTLILRTTKRARKDEISIHLEKSVQDYYRIMVENHYLKGYDSIQFSASDPAAFVQIKKTVSNLIGFEVLSQTKQSCVIGVTASATAEQFKTLLDRSFHIIKYTLELLTTDLQKKSNVNCAEIESLTKDARRYLLYCTRTLHKTSVVARRDETFLHLLLERLILIQHNLQYLAQKLPQKKRLHLRSEVINLFLDTQRMFDYFHNMFTAKDIKDFSKINNLWHNIYFERGQKLFKGCNLEESVIIYHSMHFAKLVFLISQPNQIMQRLSK